MRPVLADVYCSAGGAAMGYHMAGFDVVGFDIEPQPNYPFEFVQADALGLDASWLRANFDAQHFSPPCQGYGRLRHRAKHVEYPKLIPATRDLARNAGLPYAIENVADARPDLINPIQLCGSSFGLRVRRHRLFETSFASDAPTCQHDWQNQHQPYRVYVGKSRTEGVGERRSGVVPVFGGNHFVGGKSHFFKSVAMGIDWMTEEELNEAIPPVYTLHVGKQMVAAVRSSGRADRGEREAGAFTLFDPPAAAASRL